MPKLVVLFPGQGSQKVGMGSDLAASRPELYERYLSLADEISGLPIRKYSLEGPIESLTETHVARPLTLCLVREPAAQAHEPPPVVDRERSGRDGGGVLAEAVPRDEVRLTPAAEADSATASDSAAAIIGLTAEQRRDLCRSESDAGIVAPANFNTPSQIVVSGEGR